ncbi:MAG: substrate-binding domain-containing protein [Candidatus Aminicenantes bacterium]|nr:substrate-binding domain-containing protein [Candidatus Aminicenantes bacterium]
MKKYILLVSFIFFVIIIWWPGGSSKKKIKGGEVIILATTTSLYDSGLLDHLIPPFEQISGIKVKPIAVGTGEALKMGERGEADFLLVHAPELEKAFMTSGHGLCRQELISSRFVLVGPDNDPAGVKGLPFPSALAKIAQSQCPFISRADYSGTHFVEKKIWEEAGFLPSGKWYMESVQGMAEALMMAAEKRAYVLSDYPTYHRLRKKINLAVLSLDDNYLNIYSAIIPRKISSFGHERAAKRLLAFLLTPEARKIIASFGYESLKNEIKKSSGRQLP